MHAGLPLPLHALELLRCKASDFFAMYFGQSGHLMYLPSPSVHSLAISSWPSPLGHEKKSVLEGMSPPLTPNMAKKHYHPHPPLHIQTMYANPEPLCFGEYYIHVRCQPPIVNLEITWEGKKVHCNSCVESSGIGKPANTLKQTQGEISRANFFRVIRP